MEHHLSAAAGASAGQVRNGHSAKTVLTESGAMPLPIPRDRPSTFEPQWVEKYGRRLPGFDEQVIPMFAQGMSPRRIQALIHEWYGVSVSAALIARVTDAVIEEYTEWQHRPFADPYAIASFDAIHVKVRAAGAVPPRAVSLVLGIEALG